MAGRSPGAGRIARRRSVCRRGRIRGHSAWSTMSTRRVYRNFWARVGENFPDLAGAASTRYYSENERRLFTEHFPALDGLKILKTDLWDEAKNTRILAWASRQGARAYGVDISEPIVIEARAAFDMGP